MMNNAFFGRATIKPRVKPVCQRIVGVQHWWSALVINQAHYDFFQVPVRAVRPSASFGNCLDRMGCCSPQLVAGFFELTPLNLVINQFQKMPAPFGMAINGYRHRARPHLAAMP